MEGIRWWEVSIYGKCPLDVGGGTACVRCLLVGGVHTLPPTDPMRSCRP